MKPVLIVEREPDYRSGRHFYKGYKSFINPFEIWKLPIGTELYTQDVVLTLKNRIKRLEKELEDIKYF